MKKIIFSMYFITMSFLAVSQEYQVSLGAYDDFEDADAGIAGYQQYTLGEASLLWYKDPAYPSHYSISRDGALTINVSKGAQYSPISLSFDQDNTFSQEFYINMSATKSISFKASASVGSPSLYVQVIDMNGNIGEVRPYTTPYVGGNDVKFGTSSLTSALTTYTLDFSGGMYVANSWPCNASPDWAVNCPVRGNPVQFDKIKRISFYISGGQSYTGTVIIDDVKIGCQNGNVGFVKCCTGGTPNINIKSGATQYPDGYTRPMLTNVSFYTMEIENKGLCELTLSNISLTGTNASTFTLSDVPSFPHIIQGGKSITLTYFEFSGDANKTASINVFSNDPDLSQYNINLITQDPLTLYPEISVTDNNGANINSGATVSKQGANVFSSTSYTFYIYNSGPGSLTIDNIFVSGIYATVWDDSFDGGPITIPSGSGYDFWVSFSPLTYGTNVGTVDILSNDLNEDPFTFYINTSGNLTPLNNSIDNISSSKLYPNPVSENAKIALSLKFPSDIKVTISDMMGKEVMVIAEGNYSELSKEFSVSSLTKGIYYVLYQINGNTSKSEMLMVK